MEDVRVGAMLARVADETRGRSSILVAYHGSDAGWLELILLLLRGVEYTRRRSLLGCHCWLVQQCRWFESTELDFSMGSVPERRLQIATSAPWRHQP